MAPLPFFERMRKAYDVIRGQENVVYRDIGPGTTFRPDRYTLYSGTERSVLSTIYNRIGIDAASIPMMHVRTDEEGNYIETLKTGLNECLTLQANIDQASRAFMQDIVMSMCDEGVVAVIPVDTTINPNISGSYDIVTLRTGKVLEWFPEHVSVNVYNQRTGRRQDIFVSKATTAIIENPLFSVMNTRNSTLRRLIDKLNLLDAIDVQSASGKLDLIFQLPYVLKSETQKKAAEQRKQDIEDQLLNSKYGIAYIDGVEKITQLNRPAVNNLMEQITFLSAELYNQLGLTKEIFDGVADEATMINYYNRTIEPIMSAIADEFKRKFTTRTGRSQGQSIFFVRNPFKLVPASQIADISDKMTRNEVLTSNEVRAVIGYKPNSNPKADQLINKNISSPTEEVKNTKEEVPEKEGDDK